MEQRPPTDAEILEMESRWFRLAGTKEQAVRDELGLTMTLYAQRLLHVIEQPPLELAGRYGPLINRLRAKVAADRARRAPRGGRLSA